MLLGTWHVHRELLTRSIEGQPTVPRVDAPLLARLAREAEVHIPAPVIVPPAPRPRKPRTCRSAAYRPPNGVGHGGAATGLPRLLSGWNEGVHVYLDARPWSERREPVVVGIGRQPGFQLRLTGDELHRLWLALIMALACPNPRWHEIHLALSGAVAGRPVEHTLAALEASVDPGAGTHREDQR